MSINAMHRLRHSLVVALGAALLAACGNDTPVSPQLQAANLTGCENLRTPAGNALAVRAYAKGSQIYRWNGTTWAFVEPSAVLFNSADEKDALAIHYAGPTWEGVSGSKVVGTVVERCTKDANAIPWLLLGVVSADGLGVFQRTTFIQRLNTVGGNAPTAPGTVTGQIASVPYTAEYLFYQAQ
jgi:hypothetical protein